MVALKELTGLTFGRLTVARRGPNDLGARAQWECVCSCGAAVTVSGSNLRRGTTRSCGCLLDERVHDLQGRVFGRLTVTGRASNGAGGKTRWACVCSCGGASVVAGRDLSTGHTRSCGCLRDELTAVRATVHGHARRGQKHPLYDTWKTLVQRCTNPNDKHWPYYGGRGISVCPEWRDSFPAFLADLGERPAPGLSIDRIDNDGDYEPGNVRWATRSEQMANTRPRRRRQVAAS